MRVFVCSLVAILVAVLAAASGRESVARSSTPPRPQLDLEIAVDGTGSMASSIAKAQRDTSVFTQAVKSLLPDTRFAIVVFRDFGNPAGEYELLQPFTDDPALVKAAVDRMKASSNPSPGNGPAESYNLAFKQSYSDARLGWRASARKIVLVVGDAEPNSAGKEGLPGCQDRSADPHGLSTLHELAAMRNAQRTLIMLREHSSELSVTLQCYQSLAAGAYAGGVARDAGSDLVPSVAEALQRAYAPLTVTPDLGVAKRSGRTGYTLALQNPNVLPLTLTSLSLVLPTSGFHYAPGTTTGATRTDPTVHGRTVTWSIGESIPPGATIRLHAFVRVASLLGSYRTLALGSLETGAGNSLTPKALAAVVRVKRRIARLDLRFKSTKPVASAVVDGSLAARFPVTGGTPRVRATGSLRLNKGRSARVVLRVEALRLEGFTDPTRVRVGVRVVSTRGLGNCRVGTRGVLVLLDPHALRADGTGTARLRLDLPRGCGATVAGPAAISIRAN